MPSYNTTDNRVKHLKTNNNNNMHSVYGNYKNANGILLPTTTQTFPNLNLTVNQNGDYKLINSDGVSYKINSNNNRKYIKYQNKNLYL